MGELLEWRWKHVVGMTCSFFYNSFVAILSNESRGRSRDSKYSEMGWIVFQEWWLHDKSTANFFAHISLWMFVAIIAYTLGRAYTNCCYAWTGYKIVISHALGMHGTNCALSRVRFAPLGYGAIHPSCLWYNISVWNFRGERKTGGKSQDAPSVKCRHMCEEIERLMTI